MRGLRLRTVVATSVVVAATVWAVAASRGLDSGAVYFYSPSEVAARPEDGRLVRVGGQVAPGSIRWDAGDGVLRFRLTDGRSLLPVTNAGAPPSLFKEGAGAVVEGRVDEGVLRSSSVIVKHDETYAAPAKSEASPG